MTYYNGNTYAGPSGGDASLPGGAQIANNGTARGGQVVNLAPDTIPSMADLASEIDRVSAGYNQDLGSPPTGTAVVIRDIAAVTSETIAYATRGLDIPSSGNTFSKFPSVEETSSVRDGPGPERPHPIRIPLRRELRR